MKQYQGKAKMTSIAMKPAVRKMADELCRVESRTLANLIEVAIIEYARSKGIDMEPERKAA